MIELRDDRLSFSFDDVHPSAHLKITFQRTLRIPDDGRTYPLPPGLGAFPLRHVDDFADAVPSAWNDHGGVLMPMYQSEAMWLHFEGRYDADRGVDYPFAIKVATGKINAVTGKAWSKGLHRKPQDYMVAPGQPWLDGYCVETGVIRQFVAMPLGDGYTAEEQITGEAEHGGLQIFVSPMKRDVFERRFPKIDRNAFRRYKGLYGGEVNLSAYRASPAMGLAPGGRMKQEIYEDRFDLIDWDGTHTSRCFVHIANSRAWKAITRQSPPTLPPSAAEYSKLGLPWFDYYDESLGAVEGSGILAALKSVVAKMKKKQGTPSWNDESFEPKNIVTVHSKHAGDAVREGKF